jgi:hypothetical protein
MQNRGFIATVVVVITCTGVLIYQYVVWHALMSYMDMVDRTSLRIEANIRAESCINTVSLMLVKDYFLSGHVVVREFACEADIVRDHTSHTAHITARAKVGNISSAIFERSLDVF